MPSKMTIRLCFAPSATTTAFTTVHRFPNPSHLSTKHAPLNFSTRRTRVTAVDPQPQDNSLDTLNPSPSPPIPSQSSQPPLDSQAEEPVPGKIVLDELELARQRTELEKYTAELRKERLQQEREASRLFGWVPYAETLNGRLAMFFLVTGLLTEYWTGYSIPEQVELLARTLGVL